MLQKDLALSEILPFGIVGEGENVYIWWRRKAPVLFNPLIISKNTHIALPKYTKRCNRLSFLLVFLSIFLSSIDHLSMLEYQEVGLKCSLLPWTPVFWWGQRPQKLYVGNSMISVEPMYINSVPSISWYNLVIHLPVGSYFFIYKLELCYWICYWC